MAADWSRWAESVVYAEVVRCIEAEVEMTSCDQLASLLGCSAVSTTVQALQRLERNGMIRIKRYQRSRQILDIASGKWTKEPANKVPHWRDVPRSDNLPSIAIHTYAQKRHDEAMQIQAEIRRKGMMPADFIADLIHMGWHEYLASKAEQEMAEAA